MTLEPSALTAVSPIDGRYRRAALPLSDYFSESALIRYRLWVEVEYFIALCQIPLPPLKGVTTEHFAGLRRIVEEFRIEDAQRVKEIEAVTNHDVKAVEYFLKERFETLGLAAQREFVHFGLTSQDINNTAMPAMLRDAWHRVVRPALVEVLNRLRSMADHWRQVPMLARTHGQPASPTRLGKEIFVFVERLQKQLLQADMVPFCAKFGGATGNFNAHRVAYPQVDWIGFANGLVADTLGLVRSQVTTQIEHYDNTAAFCDALRRLNTILIDLNRDIWTYISLDYFKQHIKKDEVGSSAMPHKVNPIDFENSEGNLGLANAVLEYLAAKLPISRLQRDLTDSTVSRNLGVPLAHSLVAYRSLIRGLDKLVLNESRLSADLDANWAVVAEGIQTILRREGYPEPYEALKALTRTHAAIDRDAITAFIDGLAVPEEVKQELRAITPHNYTGCDVYF
jgi:adenylosuccinate lyase